MTKYPRGINRSTTGKRPVALLITLIAGLAPLLCGQTSTASSKDPADKPFRRFSYGFRIRALTSNGFDDRSLQLSNTSANTSQAISTTTTVSRFRLGPAVDLNLSRKLSIQAEAFFQGLQYTTVTKSYTGSSTDTGTLKSTITELTKTSFWDVPVLLRYRGLSEHRFLSQTIVEGGFTVRALTRIRTGTETLNADSTTAYNEIPAAGNRLVKGAVAGIGFQFVDRYNIKTTPEIRYTHWFGTTFQSQSSRSRTDQIEIGLSFAF
ncbi:MAG: PorT family protein [Acidobacteriia bacterium]|nr:PorT family protein [Terriglobia bacterium]